MFPEQIRPQNDRKNKIITIKIRVWFGRSVGAVDGQQRGDDRLVRLDDAYGLLGFGPAAARVGAAAGRLAERVARPRDREQLGRRHAGGPQSRGPTGRLRGPPDERHAQEDRR